VPKKAEERKETTAGIKRHCICRNHITLAKQTIEKLSKEGGRGAKNELAKKSGIGGEIKK
jgi:hypothetical protein